MSIQHIKYVKNIGIRSITTASVKEFNILSELFPLKTYTISILTHHSKERQIKTIIF